MKHYRRKKKRPKSLFVVISDEEGNSSSRYVYCQSISDMSDDYSETRFTDISGITYSEERVYLFSTKKEAQSIVTADQKYNEERDLAIKIWIITLLELRKEVARLK